MKDDIDKWVDLVKATCLLAGDWIGYEDSPDPDIVAKQQEVFRSVAVALREKARYLTTAST